MGRKKPRGAPRIVSTLLFASACACIVAFAPRTVYPQGPSQKLRLKIMPLGDSITFGTPDPSYDGYRHLLGTLLSNDGYNVEFVGSGQSGNSVVPSPNNEGHPGWTIPDIKKGLDSKGCLRAVIPGFAKRDATPAPQGASTVAAVPQVIAAQRAPKQISPREPRGIYGVVLAHRPYIDTMDNPAISGLYLYFQWAALEPKKGQFDFSSVEEAFQIADSKHKTIQIALLPGFWTPDWLLDELPSCDGWLASGGKTGPAPPNCGKATFGLPEGLALKGQMHELPLPWNPEYKRYWQAFLMEFARGFGQRDAFVSIAIAGPTSQSEEIMMPRNGPGETEKWGRLLEASYRDPSYHRSNKAFVEEWKAAIGDYGRIFSNVTLTLTRAWGLPFNPTRRGGAEASTLEIAAYLASKRAGPNAIATQNNGVMASHPQTMREVKEMSADTTLHPRVLAGGEFSTAFARDPAREGCLSQNKSSAVCQRITPEQALTNVLGVFFAGTPYGHFYGSPDGPAPVQYLQIYQEDILYANAHPPVQAKLLEASKRFLSSR